MKIKKKSGYNSYGMYPTNEYTTSNKETDTDAAAVDPQADAAELEQRLQNWKMYRFSSGTGRSGWSRSRSTSGWRAKAAAQQHEDVHT